MNRGAGGRDIFHTDNQRVLFLDLLADIVHLFRVEIHGFCLMDNHYHLLMHTPAGNLQHAMRHLNGVYTQRYNRLQNTDGALFRGRYKAILIEPDAYLLNVSRYIHLNPLAAGLLSSVEDYPWSSCRFYFGIVASPHWLQTGFVLSMLGRQGQQDLYRDFVEAGMDRETQEFYTKKRFPPVLGSDDFRERLRGKLLVDPEIPEIKKLEAMPSLAEIMQTVALVFGVPQKNILQIRQGRGRKNTARSAAIYCCRKIAGLSLREIADYFALGHYGSVSGAVSRFEKLIREDAGVRLAIEKTEHLIKNK